MKGGRSISFTQIMSALVMVLSLLWLTVSTPFVYAAQEQASSHISAEAEEGPNEGLPFSGNTEERHESSVNTLSEYLSETHFHEIPTSLFVKYFKCHPSDLYFAFHPELISPPPEQLS